MYRGTAAEFLTFKDSIVCMMQGVAYDDRTAFMWPICGLLCLERCIQCAEHYCTFLFAANEQATLEVGNGMGH